MKPTKIYIGNSDLASIVTELKHVFEEVGIETLTAMDSVRNPYDRCEVDVNFTDYKKLWFGGVRPLSLQKWLQERQHIEYRTWRKAINTCDVFIFIWTTFKNDWSDLQQLKKLGKKVIILFCGSDIRWYDACNQEFDQYQFARLDYGSEHDYEISGLKRRLTRLRTAEKFADFVFSRLDQSQLSLRPYYRYHMWVDSNRISPKKIQRKERPLIVHAPSNRKVKGTQKILETLNKLSSEGFEFELKLLEQIPNNEAIKLYENSDIVIDQIVIPGTGKLSSEAMAAGNVVLSHMAYDSYPQNNPKSCPVIDVNHNTIYNELRALLGDYDKRVMLSKQGPEFVKQYLDTRILRDTILRLLNDEPLEPDYFPNFFRNQFIPTSQEELVEYNKWTNLVMDEKWYKQHLKEGTRNGLIF